MHLFVIRPQDYKAKTVQHCKRMFRTFGICGIDKERGGEPFLSIASSFSKSMVPMTPAAAAAAMGSTIIAAI